MQINSKNQAKTIVSALRRELKAMGKSSDKFTHTECLTVMAKALGFSSWNQWEASLADEPAAAPTAQVVNPETPKYPLVNRGQFDFVKKGKEGTPMSGHFNVLDGTFDVCPGNANVSTVTRTSKIDENNSNVDLQYAGQTDFFYDDQVTQKDKGFRVWLDNDGDRYSEAHLVVVPEDCYHPYEDEDLPVRQSLIQEYVAYCNEKSISANAVTGQFADIASVLGFSLTAKEEEALKKALSDPEAAPAA